MLSTNQVLILLLCLIFGFLLGYVTHLVSHRDPTTKSQSRLRRRKSQEAQGRTRSLELFQLISTMSATLNYQKVLETALDLSSTALTSPENPADRLVSAFFLFAPDEKDPSKTHLTIGSARRFTPADLRVSLEGADGLLAETIERGIPTYSHKIGEDPELASIVSLRTCQSAFCIPLRAGLDTFGALLFAHPEPGYFTDARSDLLEVIAHQAMVALQNATLYRDLEQEKERMMDIQEEARKKLARDLHDGPTQSVAAIAMRVNFARRLLSRDQNAATEELVKIEDLARRTTKEIRHMLFTLRPLVLESKGLVAALEAMGEKMQDTYNQNVIIDADPQVIERIETGKQSVIFYIAEEAVNNARKHAEAAHVWVRLKFMQPDLAMLAIEDDGVGFNVGAVDATYENRGSLGMINMRERAELVNGILHIDSAEGKGTRINVVIPLTEEAYDRLRNRRLS
ncbi:MAG: GAF domain-containing sensor histidine kinase [Anaerolineales bacterium]|jgi:signal transduction histidine kinase